MLLINDLDISKSSGSDGISAQMLKSTALNIAPSLTKLFNILISNGRFPSLWKNANVVPIPKPTTDKSSPSGYRPVSLLPIISKLLERHIYSVLSDHLAESQPLSTFTMGVSKRYVYCYSCTIFNP